MRITDKELAIIRAIIEMKAEGRKTFTLEEMCARVYRTMEKPTHSRTAMAATLRNFGYKVELRGFRLRRISGLGAYQKGEYEFAGQFERLLATIKHAA
jgi:hypothetical protein